MLLYTTVSFCGKNGVLTSDENHLLMCLAIVCDTVLVFDTWT